MTATDPTPARALLDVSLRAYLDAGGNPRDVGAEILAEVAEAYYELAIRSTPERCAVWADEHR
jgi:hypothetical protein